MENIRLMMESNKPIVLGELSDGVWAKRYHQIRAVYSTKGVSPTLCAGMGEGGGVVPKIAENRDDNRGSESDYSKDKKPNAKA